MNNKQDKINKAIEEAIQFSNPCNILNALLGKLHIEQAVEYKAAESSFKCSITIPECQITKIGIGFSKAEAKGCASHDVLREILNSSAFSQRAFNEMQAIIAKNYKVKAKKKKTDDEQIELDAVKKQEIMMAFDSTVTKGILKSRPSYKHIIKISNIISAMVDDMSILHSEGIIKIATIGSYTLNCYRISDGVDFMCLIKPESNDTNKLKKAIENAICRLSLTHKNTIPNTARIQVESENHTLKATLLIESYSFYLYCTPSEEQFNKHVSLWSKKSEHKNDMEYAALLQLIRMWRRLYSPIYTDANTFDQVASRIYNGSKSLSENFGLFMEELSKQCSNDDSTMTSISKYILDTAKSIQKGTFSLIKV